MLEFDRIIDRRASSSLKWIKYQGRDIIPLWVADMDFMAPPAVLEALHRRIDHGIFGYTLAPPELPRAIMAELLAKYGWAVAPEWIVWLPGLVPGLNICCRMAGDPGDDVMTLLPVYPPFMSAPGLQGRNLIAVHLNERGGRYVFDMEDLERALTPKTRLLLLCNPHNPVGRVYEREELTALADFCARHDLLVCSDEIHCGLVLDENRQHIPFAALDKDASGRSITLMAPSKTYNIAGLNCAWAIIPADDLRRRFSRAMDGIVPHVNLLGYAAALAAVRDSAAWQSGLLEYLKGNRDLVAAFAERFSIPMPPVEATYLAWLDLRGLVTTDPAGFFEQAGVGLSDGREFGSPGFIRLNFGCPRSVLEQALGRMTGALARI